jgi:hypothetical protein
MQIKCLAEAYQLSTLPDFLEAYVSIEASIIWGILFGSFGLAYFIYGKKQKKIVPLICGIGLMTFAYFVSNAILIVIIGILLLVVPWFIRY